MPLKKNYAKNIDNNFCFLFRLIQEEKQTTEQRAEELESRVGSVEHMNLLLQQSVGGPGSGSGSGYNSAGGGGNGSYRSNNTTPLPPSSSSVPPPLPPSRDGNDLKP